MMTGFATALQHSLIAIRNAPLPFGMTWPGAGFALRTTVASLVALYVALMIGLDEPKWAPMTVWIVAQGSRGMSLAKSRYRIFGTVAGAAAGITLVTLFAQSPELFVTALALWLGLCTALATGLRNFRAYGAVLAGYTAAIIALGAADAPQEILSIAISRVVYICLGIITEAVFTGIFAPGAPLDNVRARLAAYLCRTTQICAKALRGEAATAAFQRLFSGALDLDTAAEYAAAGSDAVRGRLGHLRAAAVAALSQMAAAQSLQEHLAASPGTGNALIGETAALLDSVARSPQSGQVLSGQITAIAALRARVEAALHLEAESAGGPALLIVLDRLDALLAALHESAVRQALFGDEKAPPSRMRFAFHMDHVAVLHNGIRSFVAIVAASVFWILTAWPSGPSFIVLLGLICALHATRPNPAASGIGFLKGGLGAVCAAAVCNFTILPNLSDFVPLAVVIGAIMFAAGLVMRTPGLTAPATSFAFLFLDLGGPDNTSRIDPVAFLNGALALVLGVAGGVAVFTLLFPADMQTARRRLRRSVRYDLMQIGAAPARWSSERWLSKTADRLGRLAAAKGGVTEKEAEAELRGMLAALTIGDAAIALSRLAKHHPQLGKSFAAVLRGLASGNAERLATIARVAADHLILEIEHSDATARRTLIRGAVLVQELAGAAAAHVGYLGK
jgi:uncharacterized membrane protein YccC